MTLPAAPPGSPLCPSVREGWIAWTTRFEGLVSTLYLDVRGYPTTGAGDLLTSPAASILLPWRHLDGGLAEPDEIADDWRRVHAMAPGLPWPRYASSTALHLDDEAITALVLRRLDADAAELAAFWPAFPSFPRQAQQALCGLAWAVGAGSTSHGLTGSEWPHLHAAVAAQDWLTAAIEGQLSVVDNLGVARRNIAIQGLFLAAAEGDTFDGAVTLDAAPAVQT